MTPRQHQNAVRIIEARCCNYDNGNCLLLDHGEEVVCLQTISNSVCCMYFYHVLLQEPEAQTLNAALFHIDNLKAIREEARKLYTIQKNLETAVRPQPERWRGEPER